MQLKKNADLEIWKSQKMKIRKMEIRKKGNWKNWTLGKMFFAENRNWRNCKNTK